MCQPIHFVILSRPHQLIPRDAFLFFAFQRFVYAVSGFIVPSSTVLWTWLYSREAPTKKEGMPLAYRVFCDHYNVYL
jgi:hypothetical protein